MHNLYYIILYYIILYYIILYYIILYYIVLLYFILFYNVCLNSSFRIRNVSDKSCRETQNKHFVLNIFFLKSCCL